MNPLARPAGADADERRGMIAKIHVARKSLALTEGCYRAILLRVGGAESCAVMSTSALDAVLAEFKRLGFRSKPGAPSSKQQVRAVYALWTDMADLVMNPSANGLRAFVERQTGLSDPEFCSPEQLNKVIEGLKAWRARARRKLGVS
jgi:hypothetical protein